MLRRIAGVILGLLISAQAFAQSPILQGGSWTPGRVPMYFGSGSGQATVQDSGPAGGGVSGVGIKELLLVNRGTGTPPYVAQGTGPGGTNFCNYDAPTSNAAGYHYICMSPNATVAGVTGSIITAGSGGAASTVPLYICSNGTCITPGGGIAGLTVGVTTIAGGTNGRLLYDNNGILGELAGLPASSFANPTGTIGLTAVNGVLTTALRSDSAPPLSQAIAPTWTAQHTFNLNTGALAYLNSSTVGNANPSKLVQNVSNTSVMGCSGSGWDRQVNYSGDGSYTSKETVQTFLFNTSRTATSCIFYNPSNLPLVDDTDWTTYATNPTFASKNQLVLNGNFANLTPTVAAQRVTAIAVSPDLTGYTNGQVVGWTAYLNGVIYAQGTVTATAGGVINSAQFSGTATGLPTAAVFTSTPIVLVQPPNMSGGTAILDVVNLKLSRQTPDVYPAPNSYLYNIMMEGYTGTGGSKGGFVEYVGAAGIVGDPTVGSEDGIWDFRRMVAGTRKHLYLGGGFYEPGVTTDKGVGSANLSTSYWLADVNSQTRSASTWIFNATTGDKIQLLSGSMSVAVNNAGFALDITGSSPAIARIGSAGSVLGQITLCSAGASFCGTITPPTTPTGTRTWTLPDATGTLALTAGATIPSGVQGDTLYYSGTNTLTVLNKDTNATRAVCNTGTSNNPAWCQLPISNGISGLGTGVATALGVNTGSAGAVVLFNGALGTPSSGTVTNLTGTASININGTVGATTPAAGTFTAAIANSFVPNLSTVPSNGLYLPAANTLGWAINSAAEMQLTSTALSPAVDGGNSLGTTALGWQNLFGNTGFVFNIENGDWVATHTTGILTVGTGDLRVTTAGTNSASVATLNGTQTFQNKTISAANNTINLTPKSNSLTGATTLTTAGTYYAGPQVAQGTSGTWLAMGTVLVIPNAGGNLITCKLWDGTTTFASTLNVVASTSGESVSLSGVKASPAGDIRISCSNQSSNGGSIAATNGIDGNTASTLSVIRIN